MFPGLHNLIGFKSRYRKIQNKWQTLFGVAIDLGVERGEAVEELLAEAFGGFVALGGRVAPAFGGFAEGGYQGYREGAGAEAALLAATEGERLERGLFAAAATGDEGSDAFGAADFVGAEADEVDPLMVQGFRGLGEALGGVGMEVYGFVDDLFRDLAERLDGAGLVVDLHDGDEQGVGAEGLDDGLRVDDAVGIGADEGEGEAAAFELFERFQDGAVFDGGGDEVGLAGLAAVVLQAEEGEVVGLCGAAGEDDVAALGLGDGGHLVAGAFNGAAGFLAMGVGAAAGVAEVGF